MEFPKLSYKNIPCRTEREADDDNDLDNMSSAGRTPEVVGGFPDSSALSSGAGHLRSAVHLEEPEDDVQDMQDVKWKLQELHEQSSIPQSARNIEQGNRMQFVDDENGERAFQARHITTRRARRTNVLSNVEIGPDGERTVIQFGAEHEIGRAHV